VHCCDAFIETETSFSGRVWPISKDRLVQAGTRRRYKIKLSNWLALVEVVSFFPSDICKEKKRIDIEIKPTQTSLVLHVTSHFSFVSSLMELRFIDDIIKFSWTLHGYIITQPFFLAFQLSNPTWTMV